MGQEVQSVVEAVVPGDRLPVQPTFAEPLESYRRYLVELVVAVEAVVAPAVRPRPAFRLERAREDADRPSPGLRR